ncbi:hypothetical protein MMC17_006246, partial [Xylographa soralifera]|nr:hypothetical protein [Xylographa soralifera]
MQIDPISQFMFPNQTYDLSVPEKFILGIYRQSFAKPNVHFFKAIHKTTEDIVAFAALRIEDGGTGNDPGKPPDLPIGMDVQFAMTHVSMLIGKEKQHMAGRKHA